MLILSLLLFLPNIISSTQQRTFTIDYDNDCFRRDGVPFKYYSGSIHYFRVPPEYWNNRLLDAKLAGLDAVQTYVEWSTMEPKKGQFDFTGINDLVRFITLAQNLDLLVILRPGPFICAERDFGGFPAWLQWEENIEYRTNNTVFMNAVERFYSVLLPKLRHLLYENGGPIIMVQVENEYGSTSVAPTAQGLAYKIFLRDLIRKHLGENVILFTTDGHYTGYVQKGMIPGVYPTIDFGTVDNVTFAVQEFRKIQPKGPLVNSEFYTGWLDHWSEAHQKVHYRNIINTLMEMHNYNFSVNFYMFHGGTSFGFRSGSNFGSLFTPDPTSYDYDAPINESGQPTQKYMAINYFIKTYHNKDTVRGDRLFEKYNSFNPSWKPIKVNIPRVQLTPVGHIFDDNFRELTASVYSQLPLTFEQLRHSDGFVLYTTLLVGVPNDFTLFINKTSDRALVYVDQTYVGKISRTLNQTRLNVSVQGEPPRVLRILVENQGRINFGDQVGEGKGILSNVLIDGAVQIGWKQDVLYENWNNVTDIVEILSSKPNFAEPQSGDLPTFFHGNFTIPQIDPFFMVTYLSFESGPWHKGIVFLNGHNLGRYWPYTGPQQTLFIPGVFFKPYPEMNHIIMLELQNSTCQTDGCFVDFVIDPDIDSPVRPD